MLHVVIKVNLNNLVKNALAVGGKVVFVTHLVEVEELSLCLFVFAFEGRKEEVRDWSWSSNGGGTRRRGRGAEKMAATPLLLVTTALQRFAGSGKRASTYLLSSTERSGGGHGPLDNVAAQGNIGESIRESLKVFNIDTRGIIQVAFEEIASPQRQCSAFDVGFSRG